MLHRAVVLILVLFCGSAPSIYADSETELLEALIGKEGAARAAVLAELVDTLRTSAPERAIAYGEQALEVLAEHPDPDIEVGVHNEMSWAYRVQGRYTEALRSGGNALILANASDNDAGAARAFNNMGVVHFYLGDNDQALQYWLDALALREQLGDEVGIAGSLNNIGLLYTRQGDYPNAIRQFKRALEISRRNGNQEYELNHLDNLGEAYAELRRYEEAETAYNAALAIARNANKLEGEVSILVNLGALYLDWDNDERAERYLLEGKALAESMGGRSKQAESGYYLARLKRTRGQFNEAIEVADQALTLASPLGEKHLMRDLHLLLSQLEEATGDFAAAMSHVKQYSNLQETLFDSERQNKLALLQTRFEAAESEKEIALLLKDRSIQALEIENIRASQRNWQLGGLAVALIALGTLFAYRSRTHTQQQLAVIASNYNQLLHSLPLGVLAVNDEGQVRFSNQAIDQLTDDEPDALKRLINHAQMLHRQQRAVEEWQMTRQGKPPAHLLLVVEDRLNDEGERSGFWLIATNLTDQKTTQAQLVQASKLATLGEMSTGMAHELNQPLNVISLASSNLRYAIQKGKADNARVLTKLTKIDDAIARAAHIIDHMRAYGRIANEGFSEISMGKVVAESCALLAEQLKLANIHLDNQVPEDGLLIKGNAIQLEQVILNLLHNARDAIRSQGRDGTIAVSSEIRREAVLLRVSDDGGGIADEALPHIFEPFFTTKPVGQGTGLGGSISYGIIRDMQGDIWAENIGAGAQITVSLPLIAAQTTE